VNRNGAVIWSLPDNLETSASCSTAIGDNQGNSYIQTTDSSGPIVESINSSGGIRWTMPMGPFGPGGGGAGPAIGSNGSVYFSEYNGLGSRVVGFDEQTGAVTFNQSFVQATGLYAYAGGIIVVNTDSEVDYFSYDGTLQNTYNTSPAISVEQAYSNASGANGTVFLAGYPGSCGGDVSVAKFAPTGLVWMWTDTTPHNCSQTLLAATPDGGVILARSEAASDLSADFTSISSTGTFRWDHHANGPLGPAYGGGFLRPIVDVNGLVALPSIFESTCPEAGQCKGAQVEFVSQQTNSPTLPKVEVTDLVNGGFDLYGLATDSAQLYLSREYQGATVPPSLSAFAVPGLGGDYRLALQETLTQVAPVQPPNGGSMPGGSSGGAGSGGGSNPPPATRYAALGDSYSSGEGVPPFIKGTDTPNGDECHRSTRAYAEQLHGSRFPSALDFVACSGAKIANFYPGKGQKGEARGQLAVLNGNDSLVSLTVGGNDVAFPSLIKSCVVLQACEVPLNVPTRLLIKHTIGRLKNLYKTILSDAPNAQVYVLGYPDFFSPHPSLLCNGIDVTEAKWITKMENLLNKGISITISGLKNSRLHFVDTASAFAGGEMCSSKKSLYMNGIIRKHLEYSFHPTALGQQQLADRLSKAIRAG
jgi:GDSL-like Lipase/Acylhydrolase family